MSYGGLIVRLNDYMRRHAGIYFSVGLVSVVTIMTFALSIVYGHEQDQFSDSGPSTFFRLRANSPSGGTQILCRYAAPSGIHYIGNSCSEKTIAHERFQLMSRALVSSSDDIRDIVGSHGTPKLDMANITMAGQYVVMQPELNPWDIEGNLAFKDMNGTQWRLCATEAVGEYSNFWLCPAPDDDAPEALVLIYGFHPKSGGSSLQDEKCIIAGAHAVGTWEDY